MTMFSFDSYNQSEIPTISLANPDGTVLYNLGTIYDRKLELRFNTLSNFTFTAPSEINGVATDYYPYLQYLRHVHINNVANFMITNVETENDGLIEVKNVTCQSLETTLAYKKLNVFGNGEPFTFSGSHVYNLTTGSYLTRNLMSEMLAFIPGWDFDFSSSATTNGSTLATTDRVIDVTEKTLYDFLVNEVSQTFQCIFSFDTINKTISASPIQDATTDSDIFISFDNLMKNFTISESTEELSTALTVLGGEGLEIALVNPLGTNTIYDFTYYKTLEWMPADLILAITNWENKVDALQPSYSASLTAFREINTTLTEAEQTKKQYEDEMEALITARDASIESGAYINITEYSASILALETSITDIEQLIGDPDTGYQKQADTIYESITDANLTVQLDNEDNFSASQAEILSTFIIGNTYTNTNIIQTNEMTEVDIQDKAQELYEQGVDILAKISQPRYTFEINTVNFAFIKEFEPFINQLRFGQSITVELQDGNFVYPYLIGIDFNYDNPEDFNLILSNRLRLDGEEFQYNDLFSAMVDSSVTTNFNSQKWNNFSKNYNDLIISGSVITPVVSSTTATNNNIALFEGSSGAIIKDGLAMYVPPTEYSDRFLITSTDDTYTYGIQSAIYSIIGRTLFFEGSLSITKAGTGTTGSVCISLPAYSKVTSSGSSLATNLMTVCSGVNLDAGYYMPVFRIAEGSNVAVLYEQGDNNNISLLHSADIGTSASITVSGFYMIN